jgi:hypothetical protein
VVEKDPNTNDFEVDNKKIINGKIRWTSTTKRN